MDNRKALIVGATGLIGGYCLQELLNDPVYSDVTAIVRKPTLADHSKLNTVVADFNDLEGYLGKIEAEDVFCCLGTTIKRAGSRVAFKAVDYSLVVSVADEMRKQGAKQFLVISSMGADPGSKIFYSRVKGEMEREIQRLGYPCLRIIRPSLLLGPREDFRPGERIGGLLSPLLNPLMVGPLKKYRPVEARRVANFMVKTARSGPLSGVHVYESDMMN